MLTVEKLSFWYGNIPVLREISIVVEEAKITSLLGANGAGKSTILLSISKVLNVESGVIEFCGERIDVLESHEIASRGLIHVPEGRELFSSLSVMENLEMGCAISSKARGKRRSSFEHVFTMFPVLETRRKQLAGSLSGGEQQMLAIGRGLMSDPKLLMLDEPSLGLSPLIVKEVFRFVREIKGTGVTILLVEQNALKSIAISEHVYVLENGRIRLQGTGEEVLRRAPVRCQLGNAMPDAESPA